MRIALWACLPHGYQVSSSHLQDQPVSAYTLYHSNLVLILMVVKVYIYWNDHSTSRQMEAPCCFWGCQRTPCGVLTDCKSLLYISTWWHHSLLSRFIQTYFSGPHTQLLHSLRLHGSRKSRKSVYWMVTPALTSLRWCAPWRDYWYLPILEIP